MNTKYKAQIDSVLHYVNQQIGNDWSASASHAFNKATQADVLARIACMSVRNFQLYFKLYLNESFGEYIDRVRRELALQLIAEGRYTSTHIAERIGYANDTALYNVLDKKYSLTPSQYRQLVRQGKSAETKKLSCSIRRMQETPVIFLSFIGDYNNYSSTFFEAESWDKLYTFA
ncbi:MAG: helix-turn-helix domain-containing protein, partial [Macellibacteroides fermentans]|uniref:helix-turn-helix domain-containing protein n=1 Tax=Macellibacteroides fermentans TaxID=879969 RepID=UPI003B74987F